MYDNYNSYFGYVHKKFNYNGQKDYINFDVWWMITFNLSIFIVFNLYDIYCMDSFYPFIFMELYFVIDHAVKITKMKLCFIYSLCIVSNVFHMLF